MTDIRDMEAAFEASEGERWRRRRGYDTRNRLFAGFPQRVRWLRMPVTPTDLVHIHNESGWRAISGNLRQVRDSANWVRENPTHPSAVRMAAIAEADPETLPPIVIVGQPFGPLRILEGNHRAVAWALRGDEKVEALIGYQEAFDRWHYFRDRSWFANRLQGRRDRK